MAGVIRRGKVNLQPVQTRIVLDAAALQAAAAVVLAPHEADHANPHVTTAAQVGAFAALRPQAVVAGHAGVTRAWLRDPWRWEPLRLGTVLGRASLRG